ncbi:sulfatase [Halobaculum rubrum]|uniref:sulfatase n=1 Tax=Halobaculum rubrum TaxID=2872158 RepID=UPI001CA412B2|nr:sulfatase [Halobaculum rubrum]QZX99906.1 sulfatase [Halobaculum rubrum]
MVVLDTVRAQSTYLEGRETTPNMEELATTGTSFGRAIAPAPWTLPSHASMYTGLHPTEHGATHQHKYLDDVHTTLPEQLNSADVRTGLFTANMFLTESFNMAKGFNEVSFIRGQDNKLFDAGLDPIQFLNERDEDEGIGRFTEIARAIIDGPVGKNAANALYYKLQDTYRRQVSDLEPPSWDERAVADAREFVSKTAAEDQRFFGMVNLIGAHGPWEFDRERLAAVDVVPEDIAPIDRWKSVAANSEAQWPHAAGEVTFDATDRKILTHLYEAWVHRVDELAGELVGHLEREGVRDDTLVVVTADHGECIARDGVLGHELTVDESVAHVPLVVDGPGVPDETVSEPVSLTDLYGTIRSSMGIADDERHLWSEESRGRAFVETHPIDPDTVGDQYRDAAARFGYRCALFTSTGWAERRERTDETFGDTETLRELDALRADLTAHDASRDDHELTAEVEDRLHELGYKS